jgi:hypothetical protein
MNKLHRVLLLCTFVSISHFASAALITVASDNASNYGNAWAGNGGGGALIGNLPISKRAELPVHF